MKIDAVEVFLSGRQLAVVYHKDLDDQETRSKKTSNSRCTQGTWKILENIGKYFQGIIRVFILKVFGVFGRTIVDGISQGVYLGCEAATEHVGSVLRRAA